MHSTAQRPRPISGKASEDGGKAEMTSPREGLSLMLYISLASLLRGGSSFMPGEKHKAAANVFPKSLPHREEATMCARGDSPTSHFLSAVGSLVYTTLQSEG